MECLHLFSIRKSHGISSTIFQRYHPGFIMADAMQNLRRNSFFSRVLKPDKLEGGVTKGKSWDFFILSNEPRLNQEIFTNIE